MLRTTTEHLRGTEGLHFVTVREAPKAAGKTTFPIALLEPMKLGDGLADRRVVRSERCGGPGNGLSPTS